MRVVTISAGELNSQRNSAPVANQMALAAELGPIGGIRTGALPPKTARTEQLSTTARDQSIWLKRQSQSNSAKWINCQMPDSCQSRMRLQHVMPEPQANSLGNISQGIPLRRTNKIPPRQARSGTRGRPPCGFGLGNGKRASITSHKPSGTNAAAIAVHLHAGIAFRVSHVSANGTV